MTCRMAVTLLAGMIAPLTCGVAWAQAPGPEPARLAVPGPALAAPPATGFAGSYDRRGRRDPFEPVDGLRLEATPPTVATARLRGIVRGNTLRALVETPDGLGYILKVGDTLAEARLVEIGADSVVFSVPAQRGSTARRIVLRLPDD
jgi:hypothetical protein